jgi:hypothetical protein
MTVNVVEITRRKTDGSAVSQSIACKECSKARVIKKRLPQGWKHLDDTYFCPDCWRNKRVLRAVVFAVAGPLNLSWPDLRSALKTLWAETTRASNWMVKELALVDVRRDPRLATIPKMPPTYLYPVARKQFPTLPSQTVAALEQAVTRAYKSKRHKIVWTCKAALPSPPGALADRCARKKRSKHPGYFRFTEAAPETTAKQVGCSGYQMCSLVVCSLSPERLLTARVDRLCREQKGSPRPFFTKSGFLIPSAAFLTASRNC